MLKFDDQFPLHRKVAGLSDGAFRLHVEAIFWARRNLTDGFIPKEDLTTVSARLARSDRLTAECEARGTWHRVDGGRVDNCTECAERHNGSLTGNGWVIHGYADWNQTRSSVLDERERKQRAGRIGGIKSGQSRSRAKAESKQTAKPPLRNGRTPEPPRPPSGGSGGRARGAPPHTFADDGHGHCAVCQLPQQNRAHRADAKARPTEETP